MYRLRREIKRNSSQSQFIMSNRASLPLFVRQTLLVSMLILACVVIPEIPSFLPINGLMSPSAQLTDSDNPMSNQSSDETQRARASDTGDQHSTLSKIFGPDHPTNAEHNERWFVTIAKVLVRLALAALLASLLAYRSQKYKHIMQRNPYVAETQILLAVIASAMMMIVGDNTARAFGIFAAASLVRFRTNIREPKEITILLVCLGIGLAAGVGRLELALILSAFILLLLWLLEYYEPTQIYRSMELKIRTRDVDSTQSSINKAFKKYKFSSEIREIDRQDENKPMGKIVYLLNIHPNVSTDQLSDEILSTDPSQIDAIEWQQKKPSSYIYK